MSVLTKRSVLNNCLTIKNARRKSSQNIYKLAARLLGDNNGVIKTLLANQKQRGEEV